MMGEKTMRRRLAFWLVCQAVRIAPDLTDELGDAIIRSRTPIQNPRANPHP